MHSGTSGKEVCHLASCGSHKQQPCLVVSPFVLSQCSLQSPVGQIHRAWPSQSTAELGMKVILFLLSCTLPNVSTRSIEIRIHLVTLTQRILPNIKERNLTGKAHIACSEDIIVKFFKRRTCYSSSNTPLSPSKFYYSPIGRKFLALLQAVSFRVGSQNCHSFRVGRQICHFFQTLEGYDWSTSW